MEPVGNLLDNEEMKESNTEKAQNLKKRPFTATGLYEEEDPSQHFSSKKQKTFDPNFTIDTSSQVQVFDRSRAWTSSAIDTSSQVQVNRSRA